MKAGDPEIALLWTTVRDSFRSPGSGRWSDRMPELQALTVMEALPAIRHSPHAMSASLVYEVLLLLLLERICLSHLHLLAFAESIVSHKERECAYRLSGEES